MDPVPLNSVDGGHAAFASTQWGLLLASPQGGSVGIDAAWEHLYRNYCYPVYAFIRRRGHSPSDAQDLTQSFFLHLMEAEALRAADPSKGRFRNFLLGALQHFLIDAARREGAAKRGGGRQFVFMDDPDEAEKDYQLATAAWESPERLFEARWAAALIRSTSLRLQAEMSSSGRDALYHRLKDYVTGNEDAPYQQTAESLGLSLPALKSTIFRLRQRFAALLREEVAQTVADPAEVTTEMRHLCAALRSA